MRHFWISTALWISWRGLPVISARTFTVYRVTPVPLRWNVVTGPYPQRFALIKTSLCRSRQDKFCPGLYATEGSHGGNLARLIVLMDRPDRRKEPLWAIGI